MPIETQRSDSSIRPSLTRRRFIAGLPVAALALAACGSQSATSGSTYSSAATGRVSNSASESAGASSASTGSSTTESSSAGSTAPGTGTVAALAMAFKATLSSELQSTLTQEYSLANAELWSNLPQALLGGGSGGAPSGGGPGGSGGGPGGGSKGPRLGIKLPDLGETQLAAFNALLKAATGSSKGLGYDEIQQHLNGDDYLSANGGGSDYGRANFYIAFLGTPADTGTWEFQFGGHHLAVANTYGNGSLVGATPSFRGIEPNGTFDQGGSTNEPLAIKEAALQALLAGIPADQLAAAKLDTVYSDLVLGAGKDWAFPTSREGLKVSTLSAGQKKLVLTAIASYVNDIADDDATAILARYQAELDDTYLAYSGTTTLTEQNDYIRIDGP